MKRALQINYRRGTITLAMVGCQQIHAETGPAPTTVANGKSSDNDNDRLKYHNAVRSIL